MIATTLGTLFAKRAGSVDPSKFPDEEFDLYSIPAYDRGSPEVLTGAEIGSSKQIVAPGDVLLSRIVPHIRRAWIVGPSHGRRIIASGEWIVFRSDVIDAKWLRHYLLADVFHAQFMQTVAGVGGSLLRARPTQASTIPLEVPALDDQRRIAAILDVADGLCAKARQKVDSIRETVPAVFAAMFSGEIHETCELADVVQQGTIVTYGIVQAGPEYDGGVPYIRTGDIENGQIKLQNLRKTSPAIAEKFERSTVRAGDIVMSIRATVGTTAVVPNELDGANLTQGTARISPSDRATGPYLLAYLRSAEAQRWIQAQVKGATFREITLGRLRQLPVPIATPETQAVFAHRHKVIERCLDTATSAVSRFDELFASLQSRAFSGQL